MSTPDEGYSRYTSCALHVISTFLYLLELKLLVLVFNTIMNNMLVITLPWLRSVVLVEKKGKPIYVVSRFHTLSPNVCQTGATSGTCTACPSREHEFNLGFSGVPATRSLVL